MCVYTTNSAKDSRIGWNRTLWNPGANVCTGLNSVCRATKGDKERESPSLRKSSALSTPALCKGRRWKLIMIRSFNIVKAGGQVILHNLPHNHILHCHTINDIPTCSNINPLDHYNLQALCAKMAQRKSVKPHIGKFQDFFYPNDAFTCDFKMYK